MKRLVLLFLLMASPAMAQRIVIITGGTVTANVTDSADFYVTLNQNVTGVTLTSTVTPATGYIVSMKFVQDATGSRTVVFGGNISTACAVNATANSVTICRWQYTASSNTWTDSGAGGVSALDVRTYGAVCNSTTDDTTAIAAAIANAISTGLPVLLPGFCKITSGLVIANGNDVIIKGIGELSGIVWSGGTGASEIISLNGCYRCQFQDMTIKLAAGATADSAIFSQQISGATKLSTQDSFTNLTVDGSLGTLGYGFRLSGSGSGGDAENDFFHYTNVHVGGTVTAGWSIEGANAHGEMFDNCLSYNGLYAVTYATNTPAAGYFSWRGGFVSSHTVADFYLGANAGFMTVQISGVRSENSARFLETASASSGSWESVILDGDTFSTVGNSNFNVDGAAIKFNHPGPLVLRNVVLGDEYTKAVNIILNQVQTHEVTSSIFQNVRITGTNTTLAAVFPTNTPTFMTDVYAVTGDLSIFDLGYTMSKSGSTMTIPAVTHLTGATDLGLASYTAALANSPTLCWNGAFQNSGTPTFAQDSWCVSNAQTPGLNGSANLAFTHSGSTASQVNIPSTVNINVGSIIANSNGNFVAGGYVQSGAGTPFKWNGRSAMTSPADGIVDLQNTGLTGFTRLDFGGTTSSFPAFQVNGANLQAELADGSAQTGFSALTLTSSVATGTAPLAVTSTTPVVNLNVGGKDQNGIVNFNQAAQTQVVVSGTEYYITQSDLDMPAAYTKAIAAGTTMRWRVSLTKTATGTGTFQVLLKKGTNGSTADTSIVTQTIGTQTAAADNMEMDVQLTWTSATAAYWTIVPHQAAASGTGFGLVYPAAAAQFSGTISGQTTTTASDKYGLSVIFTTGTPTFVVNEVQAQAFGVI